MSELEQKFNEMVKAVRESTIDFNPDNNQKLKLYAFYKQATEGDVQGKKPSALKMVERAKWMAWNSVKGMSKEDAMKGYLKVFGDEYLPDNSSSTTDKTSQSTQPKPEHVSRESNRDAIDKIAVLGAGVMGSQIAAHFANARFPVVLFDLKSKEGSANATVEEALQKLTKLNPDPLKHKGV
jgi:3-hydroxyacyl-CoA dehydrogenase